MKNNWLKDELEQITRRSIPDNTNLWPAISARLERKSSMFGKRLRPLKAALLTLAALVVVSGTVFALGRALGYIPGFGLVENTTGVRILEEPVVSTRDGVTLTISDVIVYEDHIELAYGVNGIASDNDGSLAEDAAASPADFCGGVNPGETASNEGAARLMLPDGTVLERDASGKYPQNVYVMTPVYEAALSTDVSSMTFLLDCIPSARRGAAPEDWSVPFALKEVPAGEVVGVPVIEVEVASDPVEVTAQLTAETEAGEQPESATPAEEPVNLPAPVVTMNLTKIIPMENAVAVYFSFNAENADPSLISLMPITVYAIDSQGQRIDMLGNFVWQPFEHRVGSEFGYTSPSKPADGPLTLVVENAAAIYAPLYTDPPMMPSDEMSFTFDAGENPQYDQTWELDEEFTVAGYPVRITSARAASFEDIRTPDYIDGSQGYDYGYDFAVETDPSVKMQMWLDITQENTNCWLSNMGQHMPDSSSGQYVMLCRDAYPAGAVRVTLGEINVLVENTWQVQWVP